MWFEIFPDWCLYDKDFRLERVKVLIWFKIGAPIIEADMQTRVTYTYLYRILDTSKNGPANILY